MKCYKTVVTNFQKTKRAKPTLLRDFHCYSIYKAIITPKKEPLHKAETWLAWLSISFSLIPFKSRVKLSRNVECGV